MFQNIAYTHPEYEVEDEQHIFEEEHTTAPVIFSPNPNSAWWWWWRHRVAMSRTKLCLVHCIQRDSIPSDGLSDSILRKSILRDRIHSSNILSGCLHCVLMPAQRLSYHPPSFSSSSWSTTEERDLIISCNISHLVGNTQLSLHSHTTPQSTYSKGSTQLVLKQGFHTEA